MVQYLKIAHLFTAPTTRKVRKLPIYYSNISRMKSSKLSSVTLPRHVKDYSACLGEIRELNFALFMRLIFEQFHPLFDF